MQPRRDHRQSFEKQVASEVLAVARGFSARTWIALAAGLLLLLAALAWAAITALQWAAGQVPAATQAAAGAIRQVEQVAPGVADLAREQLGQVRGEVDALAEKAEVVVPGARERLEAMLPPAAGGAAAAGAGEQEAAEHEAAGQDAGDADQVPQNVR